MLADWTSPNRLFTDQWSGSGRLSFQWKYNFGMKTGTRFGGRSGNERSSDLRWMLLRIKLAHLEVQSVNIRAGSRESPDGMWIIWVCEIVQTAFEFEFPKNRSSKHTNNCPTATDERPHGTKAFVPCVHTLLKNRDWVTKCNCYTQVPRIACYLKGGGWENKTKVQRNNNLIEPVTSPS